MNFIVLFMPFSAHACTIVRSCCEYYAKVSWFISSQGILETVGLAAYKQPPDGRCTIYYTRKVSRASPSSLSCAKRGWPATETSLAWPAHRRKREEPGIWPKKRLNKLSRACSWFQVATTPDLLWSTQISRSYF